MENKEEIIPAKKFYKIGEVSKLLEVPASTLRFWEKEFKQIKPIKNKKGDRIFSLSDIEILKEIKYLTHEKGIRISKANKKVKKTEQSPDVKYNLVKSLRELKETLIAFKNSLD